MKTRLVLSTVLFFSSLAIPLRGSVTPAEFETLDDAYRDRRDFSRFHVAIAGYRKKYEQTPKDTRGAWRLAMAYSYLGLRVETDESAITQAFDEGRMVAAGALETHPHCIPCHFWRGVNQVLYAERVGVLKMLFSVSEVREHFKFVADHEPSFAWGAAHRFLGIIDWKLPGIFGGDNDRARAHFAKALELGPDEPMNYQVYHEFLESEGLQGEAAWALLQRGAELPPPGRERVESRDAWIEIRALLEKKKESILASPKTAANHCFKQG